MRLFRKRHKMIPINYVEKLLQMKNSSIQEVKDLLKIKTDGLREKAEKLLNSSIEKKKTGREEFEAALAEIRIELNRVFKEADREEGRASSADREANELEKILEVIS